MKHEGLNWKAFLFLAVFALAWYGGYKGYKLTAPQPWVETKAELTRQYAYDICRQVCVQQIESIMGPGNNADEVEVREIINQRCSTECYNRIQP